MPQTDRFYAAPHPACCSGPWAKEVTTNSTLQTTNICVAFGPPFTTKCLSRLVFPKLVLYLCSNSRSCMLPSGGQVTGSRTRWTLTAPSPSTASSQRLSGGGSEDAYCFLGRMLSTQKTDEIKLPKIYSRLGILSKGHKSPSEESIQFLC